MVRCPNYTVTRPMLNRIRIVRFPAVFVNRELTAEEHAQGNVFRADTELVKKLQDSVIHDQFLNYVSKPSKRVRNPCLRMTKVL